jgi:phosphoglycerate kinase
MSMTARNIIDKARYSNCIIHLPVDAVVASKLSDGSASNIASIDAIPPEKMILDVGPGTLDNIEAVLGTCKTLVWNGPLGAFEFRPFDAGTNAVAKSASRLTEAGKLLTVAGGGDTMSALANAGVVDNFSYISSAGGAFLEWLEGKTLPGVAVLME